MSLYIINYYMDMVVFAVFSAFAPVLMPAQLLIRSSLLGLMAMGPVEDYVQYHLLYHVFLHPFDSSPHSYLDFPEKLLTMAYHDKSLLTFHAHQYSFEQEAPIDHILILLHIVSTRLQYQSRHTPKSLH